MNSENNAETTAIVPVQQSAALEMVQFDRLLSACEILVKSGFLPTSIKTKEQAAAIVLTGRELGIPTMQALRQIEVIQGKPTVKPELMLARAYQLVPGFSHEILERSDKKCVIKFGAKGRKDYTHTFSFEDARALLLADKDNYKKQPATMLGWRCISGGLRIFCPQVTSTLYTPEELDPSIIVTEEGEVLHAKNGNGNGARTIPAEEVHVTPVAKKEEPKAEPKKEEPAAEPEKKETGSLTAPAKRRAKNTEPEAPKEDPFAKAMELLKPLDPNDDPTGDKLADDARAKIIEAFKRFGLTEENLADWEKLDAADWTESVRKNLLEVHRLLKAAVITKDHVLKFIANRKE